eukprot:4791341-Amphidinium_carterae.1
MEYWMNWWGFALAEHSVVAKVTVAKVWVDSVGPHDALHKGSINEGSAKVQKILMVATYGIV